SCTAGTTDCIAGCDKSMSIPSCTTQCTTAADCPQRAAGMAPWSCASGFCKRPSDVFGPQGNGESTQYFCNSQNQIVNACNDGVAVNFTGAAAPSFTCDGVTHGSSDICVDSCTFRGGCANGFACTSLGSYTATTRIGLCLPRGTGEVGDSCGDN